MIKKSEKPEPFTFVILMLMVNFTSKVIGQCLVSHLKFTIDK